ncbi:extensin family protein [Amorphus sp. 3PC139-8]|uniref:extensin-like domain-containing protein n=1 Tax=Amorphus sp. 3PC139-8 TaxID=2735676 RepID=UPI00345C7580
MKATVHHRRGPKPIARPARLIAPLAGLVLIVLSATSAAATAPTPMPRPGTSVGELAAPLAADPRPRRSPEKAPVPPPRPVTATPQASPSKGDEATQTATDESETEAVALAPVGDSPPARTEPEGVPIDRPKSAVAHDDEAAPAFAGEDVPTEEVATAAAPPPSDTVTAAPLAPLPEKPTVATTTPAPIGRPAPERPNRPVPRPESEASAAPITMAQTTEQPSEPEPKDGWVGDPAPDRARPDDVPLARPSYDPPPRPPLDDQSVARRAEFGPPKANPRMEERQCRFPPDLHVVFTSRGHVRGDDDCGIDNAVSLSEIGTEPPIRFASPPLLSCAFANTFVRFLAEDVQPLAEKHLDSPLIEIGPGTAYACRGRNNDPDAQLSEHAFGNAFDLPALRLADDHFLTVVGIDRSTGEEKAFWAALHKAACKRFKTVLGPKANAAHFDHLHLDMAKRTNGYAICE